jgi:hypothetical protein
MTDPRDANEPTSDEEFSADDLQDVDDIEVEVDDAEKVKGGRMEDPCAGGQIKNR